uniref:Integrase catalytic domain-containing protein n=1 Tax=Chromera velia CCMP2878 TaxID=1169474 RepID=A0A0G4FLR6_9ALVE|eukprot:Cvel_17495.t1-p1 / transcript=Cvel_17495.t1 / gene=Cvel_17495 / organism=Chromera_velia_CCMP2878 / gene_product=Pro-Pol polyprotein, putative / transcript_product=Pro-Pol polyprotein, putative / location=Cvel_scaffold1400:42282-43943(-) / protein_length=554 / sequence_SO=supercontig / SO=protein_coding / is_pseudo=false
MIADSRASKSLVPPLFDRYVVSYVDQAVSFRLASDAAPLSVRGVKTFHQVLPFVDEWDGMRIVSEEGCSHESIGRPLFACGRRKLSLPGEESPSKPGWVWLKDVHGERFCSPVDQTGNVSILYLAKVEEAVVAANVCPSVSPYPLRQFALSGQAEISPENRSHLLFVLHSRLGHATGQRLEATLKEKGLGVQFSVKECKEVRDTCKACHVVNFRRRKLKRRGAAAGTRKRSRKGDESSVHEDDEEKEPEPAGPGGQFNADIYHDLKDMKRKGIGRFRYMSVIVNLQTQRKSLWALRSKDHAVRHLISWTCWWEKAGKGELKVVHSDNGGEFISNLYLSFCSSVKGGGIATQFGPPLTPEVQAFVERVNDDFFSLLNKVLFQRSLSFYLWPVFIPGIANSLNEVVHGSTGLSPNYALFGVRSGVPPVALGDVVRLSDPSRRQRFVAGGPVEKSERALFGGVISPQSVSVLIRRGRQWRPLRVHPSHIQMESWLGVEHIDFDEDGRSDVVAERETDSVVGRGSVWVGWGEEDNRSDADNAETGDEASDEDVSHPVR